MSQMMSSACRERLRGNDLYRAGKLEAALDCFLSIHRADPTDTHALNNLALTYLKQGMNERALCAAEEVGCCCAFSIGASAGVRAWLGAEQHVEVHGQPGALGPCSASAAGSDKTRPCSDAACEGAAHFSEVGWGA